MSNVCSWRPSLVSLACGRQVLSDSEAWRAECEARFLLSLDLVKRAEMFALIGQRRGEDALTSLKRRCFDLEPYFVLSLPNKAQRNDYLGKVERRFGPNASEALRGKVLALHEQRQALAAPAKQSA